MTTTIDVELDERIRGLERDLVAKRRRISQLERQLQRQAEQPALVLKVAMAIYDHLADCQDHPWHECIELAARYAQGRQQAQTLAWDAVTTLIDRNTVWTGQRGQRSIRFTPSRPSR